MKIVPCTAEERPYFETAKEYWGDPLAYEQSWIYVSQATRRGGLVCRDSGGWLVVAQDYLGPKRHVAVVPMASDLSTFLCRSMAALANMGIVPEVIKHIPASRVNTLAQSGWVQMVSNEADLKETYLDDQSEDTYPQVIVYVGEEAWASPGVNCANVSLRLPGGSRMQDFRYQLRRFCRTCSRNGSLIDQEPFIRAGEEMVNEVVRRWFDSLKLRFLDKMKPQIRDFAQCFVEPVQAVIKSSRTYPEDIVGTIISVGNVPSALWIGSRISKQCLGIYVLIADTGIRNLSDFTLYCGLKQAHDMGVVWVNLGGSELKSLFEFKAKLAARPNGAKERCRKVLDFAWQRSHKSD